MLNVNTGDSSPPPTLDHKRPQPRGFVRLKINERAARIAMWLNQNFLVQDGEVVADENANLPKVSFLCLRNRPNVNIFSKNIVSGLLDNKGNYPLCIFSLDV